MAILHRCMCYAGRVGRSERRLNVESIRGVVLLLSRSFESFELRQTVGPIIAEAAAGAGEGREPGRQIAERALIVEREIDVGRVIATECITKLSERSRTIDRASDARERRGRRTDVKDILVDLSRSGGAMQRKGIAQVVVGTGGFHRLGKRIERTRRES